MPSLVCDIRISEARDELPYHLRGGKKEDRRVSLRLHRHIRSARQTIFNQKGFTLQTRHFKCNFSTKGTLTRGLAGDEFCILPLSLPLSFFVCTQELKKNTVKSYVARKSGSHSETDLLHVRPGCSTEYDPKLTSIKQAVGNVLIF